MANLSNINNKFLVTTGGNVLIGQTAVVGSSILQVTGNATFSGNLAINGTSGDTVVISKSTTEPSIRIKGDTGKDFVVTISGELLTVTQNDGGTDILTLDHDTKNATFAGDVTMSKLTATKSGTAGVFNSGTTNVVASFTSTDGTGVIQLADNNGNVEIGAAGNNFVVQPAGGVAQLTVGSSSSTFAGNVGIGTTGPATQLHVESDNPIITLQRNNNGNASGALQFRGNDNVVDWQIGTNQVVGLGLEFNFQNSNKVYIETGGNVGIGTTLPGQKLTVSGDGKFTGGSSGTLTIKHNYGYQQPNWGIKLDGDTGTTGGYLSQYINLGGFALEQGGTYYGGGPWKTDANSTSYSSVNGLNGQIIFYTNTSLTANTAFTPSERMRITSGGNVKLQTGNLEMDGGGGIYGKNYAQTSSDSTFSIIDTGLAVQPGVYEVFYMGNPNSLGSHLYKGVTTGLIIVSIDYTAPNVVNEIRFVQTSITGGGSSDVQLPVTVKILQGGSEYDELNVNTSGQTIRVKISGWIGSKGAGSECRITRRL